jgi:hypothetical protein
MTLDADPSTTNARLADDAHYRVGLARLLVELAGKNDPESRYERARSLICLGPLLALGAVCLWVFTTHS